MLQKCGVKLAQGYMIGRPSFDISAFVSGVKPLAAGRGQTATAWRTASGYRGA
jgi:hypothetical protein